MQYICCSDIHLGHPKTPTIHIVKNLIRFICTESNKDLDIIFIAGDLFDRLLDFNTESVHSCLHFFNTLIRYCHNNTIKLRVLEGTPSHDWQQSRTLVKINDMKTNKCDLKYFSTLDIEYIEDLNIYVLYIPDEWSNNHAALEKEISAKLTQLNISQVDIAILHGQFYYQTVGKYQPDFFFQEDYFLKLVKRYIHVGHYHVHSQCERIIAQGSFDRLAHGEEGNKGYVKVKLNDNGTQEFEFIVNTNSYIYKTIKITPATTIDKLDKQIYALPVYSHIRLLMQADSEFSPIFESLKQRWPNYYIKKHIKTKDTEKVSVNYLLDGTEIDFSNLGINNANILDTVLNNIAGLPTINESMLNKAKAYLGPYRARLI